jgi:hypothetical protein
MKNCRSCGEEFDFYPGEYCGDCAPKRARAMGCLLLLGVFFVAVVLGLILGNFLSCGQ